MLSYRHAFHAGNFADVLKHFVQVQVLNYMCGKEKGFCYLDTHAGAGMYQLSDASAQKTGEYLEGIAKLWQRDDLPQALAPYVDIITAINPSSQLSLYPGSPSIAKHILRRQDSAFLYDLHPTDHNLLSELMTNSRKFQVHKGDGYKALKAHLPPATRRAVVLIDPPFELKTDYHDAVAAIERGYKLFNSGTFILWYPVVSRHYVEQMERQFCDSSIKNVLQIEWQREADTEEHGMTGSGLFVVNPPWTLAKQAEEVLPYIAEHLALETATSKIIIDQLVAE